MPRKVRELSAVEVKRLTAPGFHAVGGATGLYLRVSEGEGRSWILRAMTNGKRRDIGLGSFPEVPLAQARKLALSMHEKITAGIDPVEERIEARKRLAEEKRQGLTFAEALEQFLSSGKLDGLSNPKHKAQWRSTLETYALPVLGGMQLSQVGAEDIKAVLDPIWLTKSETAKRVRSRLESLMNWAIVSKLKIGDNPAEWKGNLKELMPQISKATPDRQPALAVSQVSAWYRALQSREGLAARAVELLALTATRSGEIRLATWSEFDLLACQWVIPAARMKMKREHRIPLSRQAIAMLESLPRFSGCELLFPSRTNGPLSDMTLSAVMKRMHETAVAEGGTGWLDPVQKKAAVPHGLRSTFRDWVSEQTSYPGDMAEIALAHKVGSAVEQAYRRGDMLEKRREMMQDWADLLVGAPTTIEH